MILKKVIIDGKPAYVEVNEDEARKLYKEGIKLIFDDEDEKEDFYDKMEELDEEEEEAKEEEEEEKHEKKSASSIDWNEIGRKAKEISSDIGRRVSEFAEKAINPDAFNFKSYNEKTARLAKILPFMEDEDIHELIRGMLAGKDSFKDIDVRVIFPYLDEDDCDAIFIKSLEDGNFDFAMKDIVPFVSENALSRVVDLYLEGKFTDREIEKLYPYLSSDDIKRIFEHMMKK